MFQAIGKLATTLVVVIAIVATIGVYVVMAIVRFAWDASSE